jgi:uncharacterized GH25 family protein
MKTKIIILALALMTFVSCKKEGLGGKAKISGLVLHHDTPIPDAIVYIKYGTKESAGTDASNYDASVNADANANFEFTNLQKGDYYLYSTGYDNTISANVKGGNPVQIKKKTENKSNNIQVTE